MEGFVSKRWTGVALAALMSVVWLAFILHGSPWTGLMWVVSLAFAGAIWASRRGTNTKSSRSIGQVIAGLESEPVPATATPVRAATPAPKAVL